MGVNTEIAAEVRPERHQDRREREDVDDSASVAAAACPAEQDGDEQANITVYTSMRYEQFKHGGGGGS